MYVFLSVLGTVAFAVSGAMVAIEKKMDLLGVVILGVTTAVGGGIIRDVLIGVTPPTAMVEPRYAILAIAVSLIVFLPAVSSRINMDRKLLVLIDALGLGTFTVIGCETAIRFDNLWLQVFLGVLTGVGGGVVRDIFANEPPMIFVRHFYAAAGLIGAILYSVLLPFDENTAAIAGIVSVVVLRMLAAIFKWHLPKA